MFDLYFYNICNYLHCFRSYSASCNFLIGGQEVGEIISFSVWIIPFPVFKTRFKLIDKIQKHFFRSSFLIGGQEIGEIILFPVWIIPFPVFKTSFELLGKS